VPHHFERVGSQITGCSNLYPLNASQSVSKIRLQLFTVSCFTVNKKAQMDDELKLLAVNACTRASDGAVCAGAIMAP
jgi:hypothetical protein